MGCRWLQRKLFWPSRWPKNGAGVTDEDDGYDDEKEEHIYEEIDELKLENDTCLQKKHLPSVTQTEIFGGKDEDLTFVLDKSKRSTKTNLFQGRFGCSGEENFYIPMGGVGHTRGQGIDFGTQDPLPKDTQTQKPCERCEGLNNRIEVRLRKTSCSRLDLSSTNSRAKHDSLNSSDSTSTYCLGSYIDSLYMDRKCWASGSLGRTSTSSQSGEVNCHVDTEHWRTCMNELPFLEESFGETQNQCESDESLYGCISVRGGKPLSGCISDGGATSLSADRCIECCGGCAGVWKQSSPNDSHMVLPGCDSKTNPASKDAFLFPDTKEDTSRNTGSFKRSRKSLGTGQHPLPKGSVSHKVRNQKFQNEFARCKRDLTDNLNTCTKKFDVVKVMPETVNYVNTSSRGDIMACTYGPRTLISEQQRNQGVTDGTKSVDSGEKLHNYPVSKVKGSKFKETTQKEKCFENDGRRMNNKVLMDLILYNNSQQV